LFVFFFFFCFMLYALCFMLYAFCFPLFAAQNIAVVIFFCLQLVNIKLLVQQCQLIILAILVNIQACSSIMSAYYACDSSLYIAYLLLNKEK
jgi:hypothetical protein